jgi:FKBP-type peptidyl-prolyl cis-trans isomerase SlyD
MRSQKHGAEGAFSLVTVHAGPFAGRVLRLGAAPRAPRRPENPPMKIAAQVVASFEYHLKDDEGQLIDSSEGNGPLSYIHGTGSIIPGLEQELEGKAVGDELDVRVPPEKGYGLRDERMIHEVPREKFPPGEISVGMQVQARGPEGDSILTIVGVEDEVVRLDANHPLAGVALNFQIKVVEVRAATPQELEHGHVHGPHGHDH